VQKINSNRTSKWTSILHAPPNSSSHPPFFEALQSPLQKWVSLFFPLLPQCPCGPRSRRHASLPGLGGAGDPDGAVRDGRRHGREPPSRTNLMVESNRCSSPASYRCWASTAAPWCTRRRRGIRVGAPPRRPVRHGCERGPNARRPSTPSCREIEVPLRGPPTSSR
jgi:hypothetical protein